jgi:hypothetical protein
MIHVLCAQSERFNLSHAKEYGEVKYHADIPSPFDTEVFATYIEQLQLGEDDYIALTGPILNVALGVLLASLTGDDEPLKLLLFDARNDRYVVRSI